MALLPHLEQLADDLTKWSPNFRLASPVNPEEIPYFQQWINCNGYARYHKGCDLAAYVHEDGWGVLGLPSKTQVRAVTGGIVYSVGTYAPGLPTSYKDYFSRLILKHNNLGLVSAYDHIIPEVVKGQLVKRGEIIATLCEIPDEFNFSVPVHLHFLLGRLNPTESEGIPRLDEHVDPVKIIPDLNGLSAQRSLGSNRIQVDGVSEIRYPRGYMI